MRIARRHVFFLYRLKRLVSILTSSVFSCKNNILTRILISVGRVMTLDNILAPFKHQVSFIRIQNSWLMLLIFQSVKVCFCVKSTVRNRLVKFLLLFSTSSKVTSVTSAVRNLVKRVSHLLYDVGLVICTESFLYVELVMRSWKGLIEVKTATFRHWLNLLIVWSVI